MIMSWGKNIMQAISVYEAIKIVNEYNYQVPSESCFERNEMSSSVGSSLADIFVHLDKGEHVLY